MSGHSKWSTIKRKKGANDAARAKVFTKIGRELAVAVKQGGPDPSVNTKLKDIIAKAKQNNVPGDNIDRMLKKRPARRTLPTMRRSFMRLRSQRRGRGGRGPDRQPQPHRR